MQRFFGQPIWQAVADVSFQVCDADDLEFHLRRDPLERADTDANGYNNWWDHKIAPVGMQGQVAVTRFVKSLQQFPPRQRPATFTVDQIMEALHRR